jgi:hypothetical protein
LGAMCDQRSGDATTPHVWVNKQCVEFAVSIGSRFQGSESNNRSLPFGHKHAACGDLGERQRDRVRMGEQGVTITGIGQRCAELQIFKLLLLRESSVANQNLFQVSVLRV